MLMNWSCPFIEEVQHEAIAAYKKLNLLCLLLVEWWMKTIKEYIDKRRDVVWTFCNQLKFDVLLVKFLRKLLAASSHTNYVFFRLRWSMSGDLENLLSILCNIFVIINGHNLSLTVITIIIKFRSCFRIIIITQFYHHCHACLLRVNCSCNLFCSECFYNFVISLGELTGALIN